MSSKKVIYLILIIIIILVVSVSTYLVMTLWSGQPKANINNSNNINQEANKPVAEVTDLSAKCQRFQTNKQLSDSCFYNLAMSANNNEYCQPINDLNLRNNCLSYFSIEETAKNNKVADCFSLKSETEQNSCLYRVIEQTENKESACDSLTDSKQNQQCQIIKSYFNKDVNN